MKPINPYIGASPLRTSRVSYIDVQGKSWDSVIFQQSKSILDFDLNTMQRILQESVSQLSRTLFTSGFVNNSSFTLSSTTATLSDSRVNFFGTVARIADPLNSGANQALNINFSGFSSTSATAAVFCWIELWFQEVAPSGVSESYDGTSATNEFKLTDVYKYGKDPIPGTSVTTLDNELKDSTFGAETTRRIQVRWRIRQTPNINTTLYGGIESGTNYKGKGFEATSSPYTSNSDVFAQGGRVNCVFTGSITGTELTINNVTSGYLVNNMRITGNGIASNTIVTLGGSGKTGAGGIGTYTVNGSQNVSSTTIYGWFSPSKTFTRADRSSVSTDFKVENDSRLWIAGDGSASDAVLLNTIDGRVYGLPLGFFYQSTPSNILIDLRDVVTSISSGALSTTTSVTAGSSSTVSLVLNGSATAGTIATGGAASGNLSLSAGSSGAILANQQLQEILGSASAPSFSFQGQTSSGLYYDGSNGVGISQSNSNVAYFSSSSSSIATPLTVSGLVSGTGFSATGAASVWGTNVATGRYLGSVSNNVPTGGSYLSGDFVLDTGGFVRVAINVTASANTTSGSSTITLVSAPNTAFQIGQQISGTNIPANTTIAGLGTSNGIGTGTLILSNNATATTNGITATSISWILAGTNTGLPNSWSALNTFTAGSSNSTHSVINSYVENISIGSTISTLATTGSWSQTISSQKIDTMNIQASNNNTTLSNAALLEINGVPSKTGTLANLTLTNSYGIKINSSNTTATNAYGLWVDAPSGGTLNYAGYFNGPTLVNGVFNVSGATGGVSGHAASRCFVGATSFIPDFTNGPYLSLSGNRYYLTFAANQIAYVYVPIPRNYVSSQNITLYVYGDGSNFTIYPAYGGAISDTTWLTGVTQKSGWGGENGPSVLSSNASTTAGNSMSIKIVCSSIPSGASGGLYGLSIIFG